MREFVADVGNSRIKWGLCASEGLLRTDALPLDNPGAWEKQLDQWERSRPAQWTIAATHPEARDRFADWLRQRGERVCIIDNYRQIPLQVRVDQPEQVGIDRLLNAVAALQRAPRGQPIVVVAAGSAVTVDIVDGEGVFRGGAILPGFQIMAKSLNDYTARLPRINSFSVEPPLPAGKTVAAIDAGVGNAIRGGIERIVTAYRERFGPPRVFIAGGDAELLTNLNFEAEMAGPFLTLEGIQITAKALA